MLHCLLVYPNPTQESAQRNPPLSILYPGCACEDEGLSVAYWDERYDKPDRLMSLAREALCVGISSMTGLQLGNAVRLAEEIRGVSRAPLIWGGVHPTVLPEETCADPLVDFVIKGEGEAALPSLVKEIASGKLPEDPVRSAPTGEKSVQIPRVVRESTKRFFTEAARQNKVILPESRGCPFRCSFCSVPLQYGTGNWRPVDFDTWKADLLAIHELHPFTFIELNSENAGVHEEELLGRLALLRSLGIESHLHIRCTSLLDLHFAKQLYDFRVRRVHIGFETASPYLLKAINKAQTPHQMLRAASVCGEAGLYVVGTWMVGLPGETRDDLMATLDLMDEVSRRARSGVRHTLYVALPLPGTEMAKSAEKYGWHRPEGLREWAKVSAAYRPDTESLRDLYWIAGLRWNRRDKTRETFPGYSRLKILPLEALAHLRWKYRYFRHFKAERELIEWLVARATRRKSQ